MLRKLLLFFVLTTVLMSCSPSGKNTLAHVTSFPASVPKAGDDGLSFATAIVITETTETTGVNAEYKWIAKHYSNYTVKMQSLDMHNNKPFDIITINRSNGEDLKLYFDISNYYGKF